MLMLLFQAGNRRYALNSQIVVEVLPWASLYPATGSHSAIAGLLNYHSQLVSVIDLGQLIHQSPSQPNYGSRIILINASAYWPIASSIRCKSPPIGSKPLTIKAVPPLIWGPRSSKTKP
jgi:chemotaxis signal transduction protein